MMTTDQIREKFLNYFANLPGCEHQKVASSSLVPIDDPSLLFTNAGMNQFKDVFLGTEIRPYCRAVTCQRCVRAGGKHNDLENVGYTKRHHTFFEMLGNFSFGDYFKREAIKYAWEFLTKELEIPAERLWVTVHEKDKEAEQIWLKEMQVSSARFSHCGDKDNFWAMGDTGPCGYCSEIFYDYGADIPGDPPGGKDEGERYIEIWNLVFMQFERDASGKLTSLPNPSIDTGMGLERIAAVMQTAGESNIALRGNNYQIDIFKKFSDTFRQTISGKFSTAKDRIDSLGDKVKMASQVIGDHIRATVALVADGVVPDNERRGYVLRSIMRRAIYHLYELGVYQANGFKPFFCDWVEDNTFMGFMQQSLPEINLSQEIFKIQKIVRIEEQQFLTTLERGAKILDEEIMNLNGKVIPGEIAFMLHDTYGFPVSLTADIARQKGLTVDQAGFDKAMDKQRSMSRAASKFSANKKLKIEITDATRFVGYDEYRITGKTIGIYAIDGDSLQSLKHGEEGIVVLDKTPFYAESGGQAGDTGKIFEGENVFVVKDTQKVNNIILHYGFVAGGVIVNNSSLQAEIDIPRRGAIRANHSAAHLLHTALRKVLGSHVEQKGSAVDAERLRFDFSHFEAMTAQQIQQVEAIVNEQIRANLSVVTKIMSLEEAKSEGAVALFSEKYAERVRVVSMGNFSKELCGGTHAGATGEIAIFKLLAESGIAAGTRRIEAITAGHAFSHFVSTEQALKVAASILKTEPGKMVQRAEELTIHVRNLEKELVVLKNKAALSNIERLAGQAKIFNKIKVLVAKIDGIDTKVIRTVLEQLNAKLGSSVVLLATVADNKIQIAAGVSKDSTNLIQAGKVVQWVAEKLGGKGGGRPDMAQGSGTDLVKLDEVLLQVQGWLQNQLEG